MPSITVETDKGFDSLEFLEQISDFKLKKANVISDREVAFSFTNGFSIVVEADLNDEQTNGRIDKITLLDDGEATLSVTDVGLNLKEAQAIFETAGAAGLLTVLLEQENRIFGAGGDDTLFNLGPATYFGRGGADTFFDQIDRVNKFDGETGSDTVFYASNNTTQFGVTVSLVDPSLNTEEAEGDTFRSIENLVGTAWDDKFIGSKVANALTGRDGDDTLEGGARGDVLAGGQGTDYASYAGAISTDFTTGVTANLGDASNNTGDAKGDVYTSVEGLIGGFFNDTLTGDTATNTILGANGDDIINGGGGKDVLYGDGKAFGVDYDDTFVFSTPGLGVATIMDFDVFDRILIDREAFGLSKSYAFVDGATFVSADKPAAGAEKPTFLFDRKAGELIFDANGSDDGGRTTIAKVLFNSQQYLDINDMSLT